MAKEIKLTRKTNTNLGAILGKMNPFEQDKLPVGELIWKAVTYALDKEANIVRFSRSEIEELIGITPNTLTDKEFIQRLVPSVEVFFQMTAGEINYVQGKFSWFAMFLAIEFSGEGMEISIGDPLKNWLDNLRENNNNLTHENRSRIEGEDAKRFYEYILSEDSQSIFTETPGTWEISYDDFKDQFNIPVNYKLKDIEEKVIAPLLLELTTSHEDGWSPLTSAEVTAVVDPARPRKVNKFIFKVDSTPSVNFFFREVNKLTYGSIDYKIKEQNDKEQELPYFD